MLVAKIFYRNIRCNLLKLKLLFSFFLDTVYLQHLSLLLFLGSITIYELLGNE